ncbi:amino acid carrier 1, partial [Volvox carteri f. nagariensis]
KQELARNFTMLNNLAISTSVLSFFVLADTYGKYGLAYGGPVSVIWGWVICSAFSLVVAFCLAELLSAYPTSGGIYYWSWVLAPVRHRTAICWMAGWLNLLGQVAFTAGLEYSLAEAIAGVVFLQTGGPSGSGLRLSKTALFGIMALMLLVHSILNSLTSAITAFTNMVSFFWHVIATLALCTVILLTARPLNSAQYVLTTWASDMGEHGTSPGYTFLMGLLMSQWTIMGYDASIHVVEETIDGENAGSLALVGSVCACSGLGFVLLLSLTFAMPSMYNILNQDNATGGHGAILQLLWDVFKKRYGNGYGALGLSYIPLIGLFFCANASLCANARMAYAFSRDGAMPGARIWRRLTQRSRLPVKACWLMALLALLLGLPCVYNDLFFATVSAGSVVALSLSYGIPICLRIFHDKHSFLPGPFNLGRAGRTLAVVACSWILLTSLVFTLPTSYPVTPGSANYTAALIMAVLAVAAVLFYAPGFGGKVWFTGPAPNLD